MKHLVVKDVPLTRVEYCPTPINGNLHFLDWINLIKTYEKVYNKLHCRPIEKFFVINLSIWTYKNNKESKNYDVKPGHILNLAMDMFNNMRYYNVVSNIFVNNYLVGTKSEHRVHMI